MKLGPVAFCMSLVSFARGFRSIAVRAARPLLATQCAMSTATTAEATNAFLQQEDLPKFGAVQSEELTPAVETLLEKLQTDFAQLETKLAQTNGAVEYDMVVPAVEKMQFPLGFAWGIASHLNGVKNSDALREQYEANQPKIVQAMSQFKQSKPLYDALKVVAEKLEQAGDDSFEAMQKKRAVEISLREMMLGGVGLEGADKERFNEIKMRLAALATTFSNNVLDETKAFSLTIDDASKMKGVPDSAKAMWANAHVMHLQMSGATDVPEMDPNAGPWRITGDMPSYIAVMSHMRDREIREHCYRSKIQVASETNPDKNNVPLIYEILALKQEMAKMLGFENYAELSLASKMAPSVQGKDCCGLRNVS